MRNLMFGSVLVVGAIFFGCTLSTGGLDPTGTSSGTGGTDTGGTGGTTSNTGGTGGRGSGGASSSTGGTGGDGGATLCNDGDTQSCYSGPAGTKDVGECKGGQQTCKNNEWGPCEGEKMPKTDDLCDDLDADCDGDDDVAEGCAAYEVSDSCHGVLLLDVNDTIVVDGSSPDTAACFNGTVKAYIQPGDSLYILEDDSAAVVTVWNTQPVMIGARAQQLGSTFDHADMLQQYQGGGFDTVGLTQTVTPVTNGNEYKLNRSGAAARPSFLLNF